MFHLEQVGLMAVGQDSPKVNLQYENRGGLLDILSLVRNILDKQPADPRSLSSSSDQQTSVVFQVILYFGNLIFKNACVCECVDVWKRLRGERESVLVR